MTASFRELVNTAIEAREPLDTPAFARLAESASPADLIYWRSQIRLDAAVSDWQRKCATAPGRLRTAGAVTASATLKAWRRARTAQTATALALGLSAVVIWHSRETGPSDPDVSVIAAAPVEPVMVVRPPAVAPVPRTKSGGTKALAMAEPGVPQPDFAEAAEAAERLAYAFQPVGEQVSSVVQLLIDAVPGSDVFSM